MPTSRAGTSSSRGGFTFIELAIVLLLVGILLVIAVPRFGRLTQGSLKSAARQMYGVVATVHDKAALEKRRYWLGLEVGAGVWWVVATEPGEGVSPEGVLQLKDRAVLDGKLPGEVLFKDVVVEGRQLKEGTALAVFEPNGTCSEAEIHLEDEDGGLASLLVNPLTGRATVSDSYVHREPAEAKEEGGEEQTPEVVRPEGAQDVAPEGEEGL
jgi:prepilin-type N-terminal cleavage/methylation domain-containing protein